LTRRAPADSSQVALADILRTEQGLSDRAPADERREEAASARERTAGGARRRTGKLHYVGDEKVVKYDGDERQAGGQNAHLPEPREVVAALADGATPWPSKATKAPERRGSKRHTRQSKKAMPPSPSQVC
jgi:hypothetical protein